MVTPSLVIVGAPNFLSRTTLRPRGPRVTLTASARALTPCSSRCRASSEKLRIFAICVVPSHVAAPDAGSGAATSFVVGQAVRTGRPRGRPTVLVVLGLTLDDGEDVPRREHQVLIAAVLDLGAAVLGVEDGVADLHVDRPRLHL